ncbi:hypothetical protein BJ508DRAFT_346467 [Ascobolus immersus RN42]|uniref:Uncharacterized protein n=1 Tax=Ascobolus immersus RN42 TaxID=1160509 RepID=A0A3N4IKK3_ASCIM|nr:hypothetical protein BJ508DRAFT_346467 [Ascobolus immersus RN42]
MAPTPETADATLSAPLEEAKLEHGCDTQAGDANLSARLNEMKLEPDLATQVDIHQTVDARVPEDCKVETTLSIVYQMEGSPPQPRYYHPIFRFNEFHNVDRKESGLHYRRLANGRIVPVLLECRINTPSCDGSCLLVDTEHPGEPTESCPVAGCPTAPSLQHLKEHFQLPNKPCTIFECKRAELDYAFCKDSDLKKHLKEYHGISSE